MLLLALVMAFGGTSVAMLTGCDNCNPPDSGQTETEEYTVKFVDEKGNVLKETKVKSGETVAAETLPEKAGYTAAWVDAEGKAVDFTKGITANVEYKVQYTAKTDTKYTVEHWYEGLDGEYVKDAAKTEEKAAETDTTVTATAREDAHYEAASGVGEVLSGTVIGDGSLVLKVYYKLETHTVTFEADGKTIDTAEVKYGGKAVPTEEEVPAKDKTEQKEFALKHWSLTENGAAYNFDAEVTGDITLYAVYEEITRKYVIVADMDNPMYYFVDGNDDEITEFVPVEYNTQIEFKVEVSPEGTGTLVVKTVKTDDAGQKTTDTLTAVDGIYTVTVDKATEIVIEGLSARQYNVELDITEFTYENDWANPYEAVSDVKFEVTDEDGSARTFENAWTGGKATLTLEKGEYKVRAFVGENETKRYISKELEVLVGSFYDTDNDGVIAVDEDMLLAADTSIDDKYNAYYDAAGAVRTDDGSAFAVNFNDFAPGSNDFALTVTYDQILDEPEHQPHDANAVDDPSLGFTLFSGETKLEFSLFDAGGLRIWENGEKKFEHRSTMAAAGSLMGRLEWPDCFRHATVTLVKTGGWMYVVISADGAAGGISTSGGAINSSAPTYKQFVPMMINLEAGEVYAVKGLASNHPSYDIEGRYTSTVIPGAFENITGAFYHFFFGSKQSYVKTTAYGWTMDEDVLREYDEKLKSTFSVTTSEPIDTLTVNGEAYAGEEILTLQKTRTVAFTVPQGKIVDYIQVGGKNVIYAQNGNDISLTVSTANNNLGPKDVNIVLKDGEYVDETVFSGKISVEGSFTGKDNLENGYVRFISADGAVIKGEYNSATKTYTATVPKGVWTAYASNGYIMGTTLVTSGNAAQTTLDLKLSDYVTKDAVVVNEKGLIFNEADGSLDIYKNIGKAQESALANISFVPKNEVLEFGYTMTGMTNRPGSVAFLYPFMGMFVQDKDGGMMRFAWGEAGDEIRLMTKDHDNSRVALTEKPRDNNDQNGGGVKGWEPFGAPSGYYCFDAANYKLTVKVRLDGYDLSVKFKVFKDGKDTDWINVKFDNDATTLNIYDWYNKDTNVALVMLREQNTRKTFVNELYSLDKECVFGISARRDASSTDVNMAHFADIWYSITEKSE